MHFGVAAPAALVESSENSTKTAAEMKETSTDGVEINQAEISAETSNARRALSGSAETGVSTEPDRDSDSQKQQPKSDPNHKDKQKPMKNLAAPRLLDYASKNAKMLYVGITFFLGGYLNTLCFMLMPRCSGLRNAKERQLAGTILSFATVTGLLVGSQTLGLGVWS